MVYERGIRGWLTVPSEEEKRAPAAEKGKNFDSKDSYDQRPTLVEGISYADQKAHGDALDQERNSPGAKMARRRL